MKAVADISKKSFDLFVPVYLKRELSCIDVFCLFFNKKTTKFNSVHLSVW